MILEESSTSRTTGMCDRSVAFNNAAVAVFSKEPVNALVAFELFRGALASQLTFDDQAGQDLSSDKGGPSTCISIASTACRPFHDLPTSLQAIERIEHVTRAEKHFRNLSIDGASTIAIDSISARPAANVGTRSLSAQTIVVPLASRGYNPYIQGTPICVPVSNTGFSVGSQVWSSKLLRSTIIFNMGLMYQMNNRESPAAAKSYEASAELITGTPLSPENMLLRISLLNNYGVWALENGNGESMNASIQCLAIAMKNSIVTTDTRIVNETVQRGVRSNTCQLLTPQNGGSPVA